MTWHDYVRKCALSECGNFVMFYSQPHKKYCSRTHKDRDARRRRMTT